MSNADRPEFTNREIAALSVEKLVEYFMAYEVRRETSFKMQGRIIHSQTALMAARELVLSAHLPAQWSDELTKAITATTRVRFLSNTEAQNSASR